MRRLLVAAGLICALATACTAPTGGTHSSSAPATAKPLPAPGPNGKLPNLEIAALYSGATPNLSAYDSSRLRVIVATGGIVPARLTMHAIRQRGNDFAFPLAQVSAILHEGDITLENIETPLLPNCPDVTTGFTFCGDARMAAPIVAAGVNVVANVENNHMGNYGTEGIHQTKQALTDAGTQIIGYDQIVVKTVRGVRFGFVGMSFVGTPLDPNHLKQQIQAARAKSDVVIAELHWGKEYETYPTPAPGLAPDDPKVVGRLAIDDGADLVVGTHTHCVQGSEWYRGHLITFAHGNFLFDQDWSIGTTESAVGRYIFYDKSLVAVQYIPMHVVDRVQTQPLDPTTGEGRSILDRMARSSEEVAGLRTPFFPDLSDGNNACP